MKKFVISAIALLLTACGPSKADVDEARLLMSGVNNIKADLATASPEDVRGLRAKLDDWERKVGMFCYSKLEACELARRQIAARGW